MSIDDRFLLIRNCDIFSPLSDTELEELKLVHHFKSTMKGDYLYFEPELLNKLYFIKEGFIKIGFIDEKGNEVIKEIVQPGEVFGQLTLEKNNSLKEFAQAYRSDVSLCAFNVDDFRRILEKHPMLAMRFTRQIGQQLRNVEARLLNLLNKDVRTRLAGFFNYLVQTHPEALQENVFNLPNFLTHEDIAHLIGSSRQTVTTLINEFEDAQYIRFNRQVIEIPDVKKMQNYTSVV
jgi:CRP/FNR family transcriptional regulator, cyclic AMP receptor protein